MRIKRSSILTKIVLTVLVIYALVMLIHINERMDDATGELEDLRRENAALAADVDRKQYAVDNKDDPAVIESIIRNELGMVNPDEQIFSAEH